MTVDGINPTIGATEGTNNQSGSILQGFQTISGCSVLSREGFRFKGSFVRGSDRQGVWQMYILKVSQDLVYLHIKQP